MLVFERSSVAIKKGNNDGTTEFAHSFNPFFAASILLDENISKDNVNSKNSNGNI